MQHCLSLMLLGIMEPCSTSNRLFVGSSASHVVGIGSERWLLLGLCTDVYVPFPDLKQLGLGVSVLYLANLLGLQCLILSFLLEARVHLTDWHWMLDMLLQLLSEVASNELLSKGCMLISTCQVFLNRCHHLFTIPLTKAQNKGWVWC